MTAVILPFSAYIGDEKLFLIFLLFLTLFPSLDLGHTSSPFLASAHTILSPASSCSKGALSPVIFEERGCPTGKGQKGRWEPSHKKGNWTKSGWLVHFPPDVCDNARHIVGTR